MNLKIESSQIKQGQFQNFRVSTLQTENFARTRRVRLDNSRILLFGRLSSLVSVVLLFALFTLQRYFMGMLVAAVLYKGNYVNVLIACERALQRGLWE